MSVVFALHPIQGVSLLCAQCSWDNPRILRDPDDDDDTKDDRTNKWVMIVFFDKAMFMLI